MNRLIAIEKAIKAGIKTSVQSRIKKGNLLNEAREILKEDKKFGAWRSDKFSDLLDQKTAHNYMRLAECFSENLPEKIPLSGLYMLSKKDNNPYRKEALDILAGIEKISLKDVDDAIAQAKVTEAEAEDAISMMEKIGELIDKDSHSIFKTIFNNVGKETVLKWVNELDQQEEAA